MPTQRAPRPAPTPNPLPPAPQPGQTVSVDMSLWAEYKAVYGLTVENVTVTADGGLVARVRRDTPVGDPVAIPRGESPERQKHDGRSTSGNNGE